MPMTAYSHAPSPPEAKIILAAGLFGYTEKTPQIARSEMIDVKRFAALYGEPALASLLSSRR